MDQPGIRNECIWSYIEAVEQLKQGNYNLELPAASDKEMEGLGRALKELVHSLKNRLDQEEKLAKITSDINAGLLLDDILENIYRDFREIIPYNRIGFSLIEEERQTARVRACWTKSDQPVMKLVKGYTARLAGSSLEQIITTGQPRIINDLPAYLEQKPDSASTRLIVAEGMRSSLTCPLIANGVPIGFIFFSSIEPNTYAGVHIDTFQKIAGQLSIIVEKGRLVSELATSHAQLEEQNKELQRINELKNTFLGIAAHDLRNPISNIQLIAYFLSDTTDDMSEEERKTLLDDINRQTTHMLTLLDGLLNVTEIEAGELSLELKDFDLSEFLAETVKRQGMMAAAKGTQIFLEVDPASQVTADPVRLRQVMDNLISNAIKYSPPGSTVKVGVRRLETGWQVNVQDEGPGLTMSDRERLFQDFARLSAKPTGGERSIGLGLAISRRVVDAHGGVIGVDSEPGQGANFWFTLPDQVNGQKKEETS